MSVGVSQGPTGEGANVEGESSVGKEYEAPATQADLDRIIESRLARERSKFGDYDELKSKVSEYEDWKQSQLSDQEKAVAAAREEGKQEATTAFERKLVSAEVKIHAAALGFHDVGDALAGFGDELPLKDGEPDSEAILAVLADLVEKKPYLVKSSEPRQPKGKPKLPAGEKRTTQDGKGRAAAALRQLAQQRGR